ncbi:NADH:ubiquinone oxidoreductase complex I intermediate-associated protein 30 [Psychromonas ingrahamii 37]|uniref:NADH:ubiquinone oxidoreductase complex I intermediate-associated protein 30 n=1 Tax=Psychromonas ingrahamii (strain DSM 17664 / CCUG 51855 / 37) TaxID=357804 RepID=A1SWJ1_PSYIN|nr:CIA30 family protein [Psychromonas ingrahamii]ABM03856.1 NADH:ubiquinone oxidoreductase complex I intermediate-associated protein 30 [Psychromonas ingrahamii 37]
MTNINNGLAEDIDFNSKKFINSWQVVNDSVMGGISTSKIAIENNIVSFSGQLSFENNGGFASARYVLNKPIIAKDKVSITFKGDNRHYQLRLRTNTGPGAIAYKVDFYATANNWNSLIFKKSDFIPTYRGATVDDAPQLNLADVKQISILIADKQLPAFQLDISQIGFL